MYVTTKYHLCAYERVARCNTRHRLQSHCQDRIHNGIQIFGQLVEDKLVVLEELEVFLIALRVANPKPSPMKYYRRQLSSAC